MLTEILPWLPWADATTLLLWFIGPSGETLYFNRAWLDFRGRTLSDELRDGWQSGVHPDDRPRCEELYRQNAALRQPFQIDFRLLRHDGLFLPVQAELCPTSTSLGIAGYVGAIDRSQSGELVRTMIESLSLLAWTVDPTGNLIESHQAWNAFVGKRAEELAGLQWMQLFRGEDRAGLLAALSQSSPHASASTLHDELRVQTADGRWRTLSVHRRAACDAGGAPVKWTFVAQDVTERLHAEALQAAVAHNVLDGIISIDERGRIESFNLAAERNFGYQEAEVLGRNVNMLMPEPYHSEHDSYLKNYLDTGHAKIIGIGRQVMAQRKDGSTFPIELGVSEFFLDGRRHFTGVVRDITLQRKLEDQVRQSQKMEAVGQLAGGIAHDFNNLLTIICGYSEIVLGHLAPSDAMRTPIKAISEAGERAAGLTRQLLAFSRQTMLESVVVNLNDVVHDAEKMLRRMIGEDVLLNVILDPRVSRVRVDPGQMGQVLMNLAVNARDAMPQGGNLTIETKDVELDEAYVTTHIEVQAGRYVLLSVSDNGCGMTPEIRARAFEPFFTTKGVGRGTGLGLSVVHGIVKQSNGQIVVYSEPGIGTTFKIYLPAAGRSEPSNEQITQILGARKSESVLLVEDDDSVRAIALLALETQGYRVFEAANGAEALRIARSRPSGLDLLVTDVVMPRMNGRQLAETLQPVFPAMKVLYVSGYTDDAVVRHGILRAEVAFLQKPYTPSALVRKVRYVLDERGSSAD